jgi:hypothetical protein
VIGGDNIEGLLISSKQLPYKYLEVNYICTSQMDVEIVVHEFSIIQFIKMLGNYACDKCNCYYMNVILIFGFVWCLQFLQNQGYLVGVLNDNDIQVNFFY